VEAEQAEELPVPPMSGGPVVVSEAEDLPEAATPDANDAEEEA